MKINNVQSSSLETNASLDNENTIKCGIVNTSVITKFFRSSIYSNAIQTLTQEYVSNARDAHRELDKDNVPIEITLPTINEPVLIIRDFGPGIDKEKMKNVFSLFGASTKRHSDKFTGGFGIGSKSALSYTDSFVLITYIDGIAYHYSIYINEDSDVEFALLSTVPALGFKNGTEIKIPVQIKDINLFTKAVVRATFFWETKPNFKNLETTYDTVWYFEKNYYQYKINNFEIVKAGSHLSILFNNYRKRSASGIILVIDGIPYYLEKEFINLIPEIQIFLDILIEGQLFVVKINTGDCEIAGTREQISDSKFTKDRLKNLFQTLHDQIVKSNEDKHKNCKNVQEFIKARKEHQKHFLMQEQSDKLNTFTDSDSKINYRFSKFNEIESRVTPLLTLRYYGVHYRTKKLEDSFCKLHYNYPVFYTEDAIDDASLKRKIKSFLSQTNNEKIILIHKYEQKTPDDPTREDFIHFCKNLGFTPLSEITIEKKKSSIPKLFKKDDDEIINIYRIVKNHSGSYFQNENYNYIDNKFSMHINQEFSKIIYTTSKNQKNNENLKALKLKNLGSALLSFNYILGVISEKSEKIIKNNPLFLKIEDLTLPKEIINGLKEEYFYNHNNFDIALKLAPELETIKDPILTDLISKLKSTKRLYVSSESIEMLVKDPSLLEIKKVAEEKKKILTARYPLLFVYYSYKIIDENKDELVFYLNAKFEKDGRSE